MDGDAASLKFVPSELSSGLRNLQEELISGSEEVCSSVRFLLVLMVGALERSAVPSWVWRKPDPHHQASTGELLRCLSDFVIRRCVKLKQLSSNQIAVWIRKVDQVLLVQGWQDQAFLSPSSLVFVYLLCRDVVDEDTSSQQELRATILTCLYLAYAYLGSEISYPMKPFLVESSRDVFWDRALEVVERLSADMLRINVEPQFFTEVFQDLKRQAGGGGRDTLGRRQRGKPRTWTGETRDRTGPAEA